MKRPAIALAATLVSSVLFLGTACSAEDAVGATASTSGPEVAAKIGDRTITLDEVDEMARKAGIAPYQALYDARRKALDQIIAEHLLDDAAAARGVTVEELVEQDVLSKLTPATDEEIKAFYEENRARVGNQTFEQLSPQIRQFLDRQRLIQGREDYLSELKKKASVTVAIDPPRMNLTYADNEMSMGSPQAKITIVEYSDFQ